MTFRRLVKILTMAWTRHVTGAQYLDDTFVQEGRAQRALEEQKQPSRTQVINTLLSSLKRECDYLEIGVRNPADNFDHISTKRKFSVDPCIEYEQASVDFRMTSDEFFEKLSSGSLTGVPNTFDVIFIDGLHLADQVFRDILHSLHHLRDDGYLVMHDCNPPSETFARETYGFKWSPAGPYWNGTTWKAYCRARSELEVEAHCIDSDWGVGVLRKAPNAKPVNLTNLNPFYEFHLLERHRQELLNLVSFEEFQAHLSRSTE